MIRQEELRLELEEGQVLVHHAHEGILLQDLRQPFVRLRERKQIDVNTWTREGREGWVQKDCECL